MIRDRGSLNDFIADIQKETVYRQMTFAVCGDGKYIT